MLLVLHGKEGMGGERSWAYLVKYGNKSKNFRNPKATSTILGGEAFITHLQYTSMYTVQDNFVSNWARSMALLRVI